MKTKKLVGGLFLSIILLITSLSIYSIRVYANNGYTLTLDSNCDELQGITSYLNIRSFQLPALQQTGRFFAGWSKTQTGIVEYRAGDTVTLESDLTLYARWAAKENCTISFHANGGTGSMDDVTWVAGTRVNAPTCQFSRTDHVFWGWAISPSGDAVYRPGSADGTGHITLVDDLDLYAVWKKMGSYSLSPTSYTLLGSGYTDISCKLTLLMEDATSIGFFMNGGTLSDGNGHNLEFLVDDSFHFGASQRGYQGYEHKSNGETFVMAVYIDPDDFSNATPGIYTGTFIYESRWRWKGGDVEGPLGSIALMLAVPDAEQETVATPTFSLAGGTYTSAQGVTISCATAGADIYYTTDGSAPTTGSTKYTGAISVGTTTTIKAIAVKDGMTNSSAASATYTISIPPTTTPTPTPTPTAAPTPTTTPTPTQKPTPTTTPVSESKPQSNESSDNAVGERTSAAENNVSVVAVSRPVVSETRIEANLEQDGWEAIKENIAETIKETPADSASNSTFVVDMGDKSVVPSDVFSEIKGKNVTAVFELADGVKWTINGKDVTGENFENIDFGVKIGTNEIPEDVIESVPGAKDGIQISLAHEGNFGFSATLSIDMGTKNAGQYANLFYYNETGGKMELICSGKIDENGEADLEFTHASDYVIVVNKEPISRDESEASDVLSTASDADEDMIGSKIETEGIGVDDSAIDNDTSSSRWIIVLCGVIVLIGIGGFYVFKKR